MRTRHNALQVEKKTAGRKKGVNLNKKKAQLRACCEATAGGGRGKAFAQRTLHYEFHPPTEGQDDPLGPATDLLARF